MCVGVEEKRQISRCEGFWFHDPFFVMCYGLNWKIIGETDDTIT